MTIAPPPDKDQKQTLTSSFGEEIRQQLEDIPASLDAVKSVCKAIHTATGMQETQRYQLNQVLQHHPPKLTIGKKELSREAQTALAQFRSGFSIKAQQIYGQDHTHQMYVKKTEACPMTQNL